MSDFWKELFNRLPDWFFSVTAGLILLTLAVVLIWFILGAKRFSDAMGRENRLAILQDEISKERDKSRESSEIASQISRALENAQVYLNQLNA
ncbi:hypothetical protein [Brevibacillus massiliensis]|uniref:hypothetical protein n=1 Tax=Brevibacillus massiliensis TaxID=1118054 RepID=UPI00030CEE29|nr:hypothetical protein [Brevibacillus massiliensis]